VAEYKKPTPIADADSKEFWDGCHRHEFQMQKCDQCNKYYFPTGPICPHCFSTNFKWEKLSGKAEVYSFVIVRRSPGPDWDADVPYVMADIQLAEGPRMISNVIGCKPEDVKIGMKVEVTFDDVTETVSLPKFKPV
jgi:uncharacterized protein